MLGADHQRLGAGAYTGHTMERQQLATTTITTTTTADNRITTIGKASYHPVGRAGRAYRASKKGGYGRSGLVVLQFKPN
jgi:hypothetical protein